MSLLARRRWTTPGKATRQRGAGLEAQKPALTHQLFTRDSFVVTCILSGIICMYRAVHLHHAWASQQHLNKYSKICAVVEVPILSAQPALPGRAVHSQGCQSWEFYAGHYHSSKDENNNSKQ